MNEEKLKIIYSALDSLEGNPLFKGMWKYVVNSGERIEISLYIRDTSLKYTVEARRELRLQQLPRLMQQADIKNSIIIADKIYPDVKEQLVANGIAYIEGNGNVFIPLKELYIWVDTNKSISNIKRSSGRAFTKTGLKVLFHFLLNEALLNMSYRQIAELTQTSPGNITNIMNSLRELNFLSTGSEGKLKLNNKKQMLDKWIDQYEHELKPAIEIGTFRFAAEEDYQNWRRIPLEAKKTLWGGEPAGHLMTGLLKPRTLTIYSLESAQARGATILGEVLGYGFSSNGQHISNPSVEGQVRSIGRALKDAGLSAEAIQYINAHATSTPAGDGTEADAIFEVFGGQVPVSSTKSMTGHECWMAGASEVAYSMLMMQNGFIAPNINFETPDEHSARINIIPETLKKDFDIFLSNSFGFGGTNSSLVIKRWNG